MNYLFRNTISVVSLFLLLSCGKSPKQYANEWCKLNEQIAASEGEEKEKLITKAKDLENEIYERFKDDPSSMEELVTITDECD